MVLRAQKIFPLLRALLAVALLYFLLASGAIDWRLFSGLIDKWPYTCVSIVLFFGATLTHALRLVALMQPQDLRLGVGSAAKLTFIGLFFNTFLPGSTGGDVVKIYYASKGNQGRRTEVVTIMLWDRFVGLFALLTLPVLIAPFFSSLIWRYPFLQVMLITTTVISVAIVVAVIFFLKFDSQQSRIINWAITGRRYGGQLRRVIKTLNIYHSHWGSIRTAVLYSWLHQLLMVCVALTIAEAIVPTGADRNMIALMPFGYLANALPITPGGLGVGEAALESIFAICGLQGGAEVLIGWRLVMIAVALAGLLFFLKGEKQLIFSRKVT